MKSTDYEAPHRDYRTLQNFLRADRTVWCLTTDPRNNFLPRPEWLWVPQALSPEVKRPEHKTDSFTGCEALALFLQPPYWHNFTFTLPISVHRCAFAFRRYSMWAGQVITVLSHGRLLKQTLCSLRLYEPVLCFSDISVEQVYKPEEINLTSRQYLENFQLKSSKWPSLYWEVPGSNLDQVIGCHQPLYISASEHEMHFAS